METSHKEIWAHDRFSEEGADIVRDIKLANYREKENDAVKVRTRSQSYSGNWNSMRSLEEGSLSSGTIATPGGFRRSHIADKFNLKFEFLPFQVSTAVFDDALPNLQEQATSDDFTKGNIIGIGGGVGPAAGVALHSKIIENTITDGTDQSHFEVYHLSRSNDLPDRTKYLLGLSNVNPADGLARTMKALNAASSSFGQRAVAGIPCNTFHAPPIWSSFVEQVQAHCGERVTVVHMLEECQKFISDKLPDVKRIGIMSTTGTREVHVYDDLLEAKGYECLWVPQDAQAGLHDAIYNTEWGIKAVFPVTETARKKFLGYAHYLAKQGAQAIILGCTEIPLALPEAILEGTEVVLVDPVLALARALIREADPAKLKDLPSPEPQCDSEPVSEADDDDTELESYTHRYRSDWMSENDIDTKGWGEHFKGRPDRDVALHKLLLKQQEDIEGLRDKMDKLIPEVGDEDLGFTSMRKLSAPDFPKRNALSEQVNVVLKRGAPLAESVMREPANVDKGLVDLDMTNTTVTNTTECGPMTGHDKVHMTGCGPMTERPVQDQLDSPNPVRERADSTVMGEDMMKKYLKFMIGLTVLCCLLLLATGMIAYQIFSSPNAGREL